MTFYEFLATAKGMSWFEIAMLVCFAASWPVSIRKTWKMKLGREKSYLFAALLAIGYVFGILNKVYGKLDIVVLMYAFNLVLVLVDMGLGMNNMMRQRRKENDATR